MKFPFMSRENSKSKKTYLGLFLKEEEGIGLVLSMENGHMTIVEKEKITYSNGWENIIQDIDEMLFKFERQSHISLDQTIFFVYSHFIDDKLNDIKKPYLQKIKEIVKNLELHALGYIECSEAILSYLEKKEEMPLTAIVTELDKTNIGINIYKGGRKTLTKILSRTDNLIDDFLACFQEVKGKTLLPARIILYNSRDLDDVSTQILTYRWSEDFFIQIPRVEILKEEEVLTALVDVFQEQVLKNTSPVPAVPPPDKEVMGFVIGQDVRSMEEDHVREKPALTHFSFKIFVENIKKKLPVFRLPTKKNPSSSKIRKKYLAIGGAAIIVLALILNEVLLHKATLTVFLPAQSIQKQLSFDASFTAEEAGNLAIFVATSSASYSDTKATSGKRDIGDSARGSVTISSFDDQEKLFAKGFTLTTGNLPFTLDNDVKVASASLTTDGSAKLPGKATGSVTAVSIGTESNIGKGQRFSFSGLSSSVYFAVNDSAFTGGSKKQVQTVAKQDLENLKESLINKAKLQLQNQSGTVDQNEEIIPQLSKIELRDMKFSKEVGEEASELSLQATADFVNFYLRKDDLTNQIVQQINPDIQPGFKIDKAKMHYSIDKISQDEKHKTASLTLSVDAKAVKDISGQNILSDVAGRNKSMVESVLKKKYGVDGYELTIKDPLPVINMFLPFMQKNIHLIISSL